MVFGSPPFKGENHVHLLRVIEATDDTAIQFPTNLTFKQTLKRPSSTFSKEKQSVITINIETSDIFRDLLSKLLRKDPNKRITFKEFFSHPFISGAFSISSKFNPIIPSSPTIGQSSFAYSSLSDSQRNSIDDVLKLDDESLLEIFDSLDQKQPPVKMHWLYYNNFKFLAFNYSEKLS